MMNEPYDFFTLAHGFVGFLFGKLKLNRWLCYSIAIGWEIFELYFQYKPQGFGVEHIWLNSLIDIIAFVVCYEGTVNFRYLRRHPRYPKLNRGSR